MFPRYTAKFCALSLDAITQSHKGALYTVHLDALQAEVDIYLHCVLLLVVAKVRSTRLVSGVTQKPRTMFMSIILTYTN